MSHHLQQSPTAGPIVRIITIRDIIIMDVPPTVHFSTVHCNYGTMYRSYNVHVMYITLQPTTVSDSVFSSTDQHLSQYGHHSTYLTRKQCMQLDLYSLKFFIEKSGNLASINARELPDLHNNSIIGFTFLFFHLDLGGSFLNALFLL